MISFIVYPIALISLAAAQTIVPTAGSTSFPACALSCTTLLAAQSACIPPAAPTTNQAIYVSCFCQNGHLTALHDTPDGTCDQWCVVESDREELQKWYNNLCTGVATSTSTSIELYPITTTSGAVIFSTQGGGLVTFLTEKSASSTITTSGAATSTTSATAGGLATSAKAGIGVGVALAVLLAVAVVAWLILSRRGKNGVLGKKQSQRRYDKPELDSGAELLRTNGKAQLPIDKGRAELLGDIPQIRASVQQEHIPPVFEEKEMVYEI